MCVLVSHYVYNIFSLFIAIISLKKLLKPDETLKPREACKPGGASSWHRGHTV